MKRTHPKLSGVWHTACQSSAVTRNFASARTLQSVVQEVLDRQAQRIEATGTRQRLRIVASDIAEIPEAGQQLASLLEAFSERFVGLDNLKNLLRKLAVSSAARRSRGAEAPPAPRLLFLGNPGTGKTMAAREAAKLLRGIGCTSTDRVVEVRGVELKGSYLGQTKDRVLKAFQDSRGGVLIIDEAYALQTHDHVGGDSFATEAIDTLVGQAQLPENLRTAVILAGYTEPMRRFLRSNPGLDRRFRRESSSLITAPLSAWTSSAGGSNEKKKQETFRSMVKPE